MSSRTQAIIRIVEQLPEAQQTEVMDFAQFLLDRGQDKSWETEIDTNKSRPKLEEFLKASRAEGSEPLNTSKL